MAFPATRRQVHDKGYLSLPNCDNQGSSHQMKPKASPGGIVAMLNWVNLVVRSVG